MGAEAPSKSSSFTSDDGKFYVKPNYSRSPSTDSDHVETTPQKNNNHVLKRNRDETVPTLEPSTSKSKKKKKGSAIDLEELLAQTYSKDASTTRNAEEKFRRSTRRNYRPAKSADLPKKWSGEEEICIAQALLDTCSPAGELNLNAFYERAKKKMQGKISKSQLYDKMRNMSKRFLSIQSKITEQNISEESFAYRTPHEPALFKLWKQIWHKSSHVSENEEPNKNISENEVQNPGIIIADSPGVIQAADNPGIIKADNPGVIEADNPRVIESDDGRTACGGSSEGPSLHLQDLRKPSSHQTLEEDGRKNICCKSDGLEKNMKDMVGNMESRLQALIHSSINCLVGLGFGGGCACSGLSSRMRELIDAVNNVEEFPGFSDEQAKELQRKWRMHKIDEVKMFCECLGLLHNQCKLFLQNLEI